MIFEARDLIGMDKETLRNMLATSINGIYIMTRALKDFDMDYTKAYHFAQDAIDVAIMNAKKEGEYKYDDSRD